MDTLGLERLSQLQNWPLAIWVLIITTVVCYALAGFGRRSGLPASTPKLLKEGYPVFGAVRFFTDRFHFFRQASLASQSGNFSFFFGKHHIVGVSGVEGRKTFFDSRDLNMGEGYATLLTAAPAVPESVRDPEDRFEKYFARSLTALLKRENFVKNLDVLVGDARAGLEKVVQRYGAEGVMDPFDDIYRIVYRLTMRTVGATEIATSPELLEKTLNWFHMIENNVSPARLVFPWLPTPNHLKQLYAGTRLYFTMDGLIKERKKSGRREDDALQFLIENGGDTVRTLSFVIGALFAGQVNSGINAAWCLIYLATTPEWYKRVREEVDAVVKKRRSNPGQSAMDVIASFTLDDWEQEFPMIDLCLRESIRILVSGTGFRKNISGKEIPIGKTGEIIPADSFAIFLIDEVHMNPDIYRDPYTWDPSRYLPDRAEDKKQPFAYLGWGAGRHPCLGMKFAKLEITVILASFVAMFDFEYMDVNDHVSMETPRPERAVQASIKFDTLLRLKYRLRDPVVRGVHS